jgi:hypothetical protein
MSGMIDSIAIFGGRIDTYKRNRSWIVRCWHNRAVGGPNLIEQRVARTEQGARERAASMARFWSDGFKEWASHHRPVQS